MTTPVEAQLWLWLRPSWTPSQNHLGWRRWSDSSSTCRSSSVTGLETKAWSVHWFWCSKIMSHLPKNLFKPLDFFLVSAADGGAASATLGFGGAATARSRWSVVLCWGAAVDRSQLKIIMGYGSNRAGDGANVTVCVISSYQEKKKKNIFWSIWRTWWDDLLKSYPDLENCSSSSLLHAASKVLGQRSCGLS